VRLIFKFSPNVLLTIPAMLSAGPVPQGAYSGMHIVASFGIAIVHEFMIAAQVEGFQHF